MKQPWGYRSLAGDLPGRGSVIRLVGAVLAAQDDEWAEGQRCRGREFLAKARVTIVPGHKEATAAPPVLTA